MPQNMRETLLARGPVSAQLAEIAPDSSGASDPTTSTVGVVKQRYLNTTTGQYFVCRSVAGSVYTWEAMARASVVAGKSDKALPAFSSATLLNSWTGTLEYSKFDTGIMLLKFNLTAGTGTSGTAIATMPTGYRPLIPIPISLYNGGAGGITTLLFSSANGNIALISSTTTGYALTGSVLVCVG